MQPPTCNPTQFYCNPSHPYQYPDQYFTPLIYNVQQADYRPLQFGAGTDNNRFQAKENYGPQCQFVNYANLNPPANTSWFGDPNRFDCCVPKAGCPASHVVPHTVVLATFPAATDALARQHFHQQLLGLMYDLRVDRVDVLCPTLDDRFDLIEWLQTPQGHAMVTKIKPYVTGCPVDTACLRDYQRRFLQGRPVLTLGRHSKPNFCPDCP